MASSPDSLSEGKDVLKKYLETTTDTSTSENSTEAKDTADKLLDLSQNDLEIIGGMLLETAQDQASDSRIQQLIPVVRSLKQTVERELYNRIGWVIRDAWNYQDPDDDDPDQSSKREVWRRTNAFVAMLAAADDDSYLLLGLWTLRLALESDDPNSLPASLAAAAMWIIYAGKAVYESDNFRDDKVARPGPKYDGPGGFNHERWQFWQGEFEAAQHDTRLDVAARDLASRAVDNMRKLAPDG